MISFASDYLEGCLPEVLQRLIETNAEQSVGYGEDEYCRSARDAIRRHLDCEADIHFAVGGTMANAMVIRHVLLPHQGVIAPESGHIAVHETGAIEAGGHKVLTCPAANGKITAAQVEAVVQAHRSDFAREHTVQPAMVYVSQPTECGTLYTKEELGALHAVCEQHGLTFYIDGARLAYALASGSDLLLSDYPRVCHVLSLGGTKCGLLMGEAICFFRKTLAGDFRYVMKQSGGMLAKGRLLGLQFLALFENDLYVRAAGKAIGCADRLRRAFSAAGFDFAFSTGANQLFPVLPPAAAKQLKTQFDFEPWQTLPDGRVVWRFCTSWATTESQVAALEDALLTIADT